MNRKELLDAIAISCHLTHQQAAMYFDALESALTEGLKRDGKVTLTGFGTFECRRHAPRQLYDPNSGRIRMIKGSTTVGFRPAVRLKKAVEKDET